MLLYPSIPVYIFILEIVLLIILLILISSFKLIINSFIFIPRAIPLSSTPNKYIAFPPPSINLNNIWEAFFVTLFY